MRFIVSLLLSALLAFAAGLYFPWWSVAAAGFVVAVLIRQPPLFSFLAGFSGVLALWLLIAMVIDSANGGLLSARISKLMGFGSSGSILVVVTAVVGAIPGGLGALTGSLLQRSFNLRP